MNPWNISTDAPDELGLGLKGLFPKLSLQRALAHGSITADANETVVFTRQLEHLEAEVLEADYRDVMYREIVDVQTTGMDPADKIYTWRESDYTVEWQEKVGLKKASDLSLPSMERGEQSVNAVSFMSGFAFDFQDLREAQRLGIPLNSEYAMAVREGWERLLENIVASGYGDTGLGDITSHASVNVDTESNKLEGLSAENLLIRLKAIISDRVLAVKNIPGLLPNQMVVYPALYEAMVTKHMSTDNTRSVMQEFQAHLEARGLRDFRILSWYKLAGAGASAKNRILLYRKDRRVARLVVPVNFEMLPVHRELTGWITPCHGRTCGVIVPKPAGMNYIDSPLS